MKVLLTNSYGKLSCNGEKHRVYRNNKIMCEWNCNCGQPIPVSYPTNEGADMVREAQRMDAMAKGEPMWTGD